MSAAPSYSVLSPQWILNYAGVNISGEVSAMVRAITYVDRLGGKSGDLCVEVEDHAQRWQGPWYPALGDGVQAFLGYSGGQLLECGSFQVDDLQLSGPPDVFRLRCLAAYVTPAMRTRNSAAYEGQTLLAIASTIAGKYGLALISAPNLEDVAFSRVTQRDETDLEFLARLADDFGYEFTVRGAQIVFYARTALAAAAPIATIVRSDLERFEFRNRTRRIYSTASAAYFDPAGKRLIMQSASASAATPTGDTLKIIARCENATQAGLRAAAGLIRNNQSFFAARLSGPGNPALMAGCNVLLSGWGMLDGVYLIEPARHLLSRERGYMTEVEALRSA
ncbi:MAG: phage late control D family protein [Candidatus Binataceae bacterium]